MNHTIELTPKELQAADGGIAVAVRPFCTAGSTHAVYIVQVSTMEILDRRIAFGADDIPSQIADGMRRLDRVNRANVA